VVENWSFDRPLSVKKKIVIVPAVVIFRASCRSQSLEAKRKKPSPSDSRSLRVEKSSGRNRRDATCFPRKTPRENAI